jgi:hypothetical protein
VEHIAGFLLFTFGLASAFILAGANNRLVVLGYINLFIALLFLFMLLFFGVVLGGAIGSDAVCSNIFILSALGTPLFGWASYVNLRKR